MKSSGKRLRFRSPHRSIEKSAVDVHQQNKAGQNQRSGFLATEPTGPRKSHHNCHRPTWCSTRDWPLFSCEESPPIRSKPDRTDVCPAFSIKAPDESALGGEGHVTLSEARDFSPP